MIILNEWLTFRRLSLNAENGCISFRFKDAAECVTSALQKPCECGVHPDLGANLPRPALKHRARGNVSAKETQKQTHVTCHEGHNPFNGLAISSQRF